jgi:MFS transporter, ACS family, DAL5 transporter family protein
MNRVGGYNGWRWIFIIEGLVTVAIAAVSKPLIVDWPETAKFLNAEERELLACRLAMDNGCGKMDRLDKPAIKRVLSDVKIYLG